MLFKIKINKDTTDEKLMKLITKGNRDAFSLLYDRYADKMLKFFYFRLNYDNDSANDFVQDLFIKIIEKPEQFDVNKCFSSWLYTMASNMIKNEYKKTSKRAELLELYQYNSIDFSVQNELYDEFKIKLDKELEQIDVINREIFKLRFSDELSIKQIAEIVDIPEGTVKSKLFYTIKKLSVQLSMYNPKVNN